MQEIKTVVYKGLELDDIGVNYWLSQGWEVYDLATSVTLNEESEAGNGMTVIRIFTLIRDIPDATEAQDAPQTADHASEHTFEVRQRVRVTHAEIDGDKHCVGQIGIIEDLDTQYNTAVLTFPDNQTLDDMTMWLNQLEPADDVKID